MSTTTLNTYFIQGQDNQPHVSNIHHISQVPNISTKSVSGLFFVLRKQTEMYLPQFKKYVGPKVSHKISYISGVKWFLNKISSVVCGS